MKRSLVSAAILAAVLTVLSPGRAQAQETQVKPYMLIIFDTSGSMLYNSGSTWTYGDGTHDYWSGGSTNCCLGDDTNGNGLADDSRLYQAKEAIRLMVASSGDVTFGLMKFPQRWSATSSLDGNPYIGNQSSWPNSDYLRYSGWTSTGAGYCSSTNISEYLVVPISAESSNSVYTWVNHTEYTSAGNPKPGEFELRGVGTTPLAWTINQAETYFAGTGRWNASTGVIPTDPYRDCPRPYAAIILTDGEDACSGNAPAAVQNLYNVSYGGSTYHVRSYVIGFAFSSTTLNQMADYGDDGLLNSSTPTAYRANDLDELSAILASIVEDSVLVEVCDGDDNDCDGAIDEGFTLYCNIPGGHPAVNLCTDPGETLCNGVDDNCDTIVDEGLLNDCGTCGALTEICNSVDDDCDSFIDEGGVCGSCVPTGEICDNADNDCDTIADNGLVRDCGTDVGECVSGTQTCTAGTWGTCVGSIGPALEDCDGFDNNCDGLIDGFTRSCGDDTGECEFGYQICVAASWTACNGGVNPRTEVCDNVDNDCDTVIDDGNPGGGADCGTELGECESGTVQCVGGALVCAGGTMPVAELCNGLDDDCDGVIDDGNPEGGAPCGPVSLDGVGICEAGVTTCVTAGAGSASLNCIGSVYPAPEDCNGLDDDCNDLVDDGLAIGGSCGSDVGECVAGTEQCVTGSWVCVGEVGPTAEVCDGLDNDCDGAQDEGNPGGGLICGTDVGECEPGVTLCDTTLIPPDIVCFGEVGPSPEVCDGLDNDCNGIADDGLPLGDECGIDDGECATGNYRCTEDGELECVGGIGPADEVCDGLDNDCDTILDDEAVCPVDGYICWEGYCVGPCDPTDEWPCSTGRVCTYIEEYDTYYCVGDPCSGVTCTDPCAERCYGGTCQSKCEGVSCPDGQVCVVNDSSCNPECIRADCYAPGFECDETEICVMGACQDNPCWDVVCGTEQFCRDGECIDSCVAELVCADGQICEDGVCVDDPCHGVECSGGLVCDPATGTCIGDPCEGVVCPAPQVCNPDTGTCYDEPCSYIVCPEGYECIVDQCVDESIIPHPDETPEGTGTDADTDAGTPGQDIIATGAGGCAGCTMTSSSSRRFPADAAPGMLAMLMLAMAVLLRRRARHGR
jgi:hypothetical protein